MDKYAKEDYIVVKDYGYEKRRFYVIPRSAFRHVPLAGLEDECGERVSEDNQCDYSFKNIDDKSFLIDMCREAGYNWDRLKCNILFEPTCDDDVIEGYVSEDSSITQEECDEIVKNINSVAKGKAKVAMAWYAGWFDGERRVGIILDQEQGYFFTASDEETGDVLAAVNGMDCIYSAFSESNGYMVGKDDWCLPAVAMAY